MVAGQLRISQTGERQGPAGMAPARYGGPGQRPRGGHIDKAFRGVRNRDDRVEHRARPRRQRGLK